MVKEDMKNDTFKLMPYDWDSECTCGLEDMIDKWWEGKVHKDNCYQKELIREKIKHGWIIDISSNIEHTPQNMNFEKYSKIEDKIYKKLCKKYNLPRAGCAVHCTCGLDESFEEWVKDKKHKNNCRLIQPNFLYKPTGFQIMCYKYFLRDSYMNQNINLDEFREILKNCVESYKNE